MCQWYYRMTEPENLVDLALDALGKYFFMLYKKQKSLKEAEVTSNHIHHKIIEYIPATLADKVTNGLLESLDHWISEGESCQPAAVLELFIKSILHPAVTQIKPVEDFQDIPEIFYTYGFKIFCYPKSILKNIHLLKNLKTVNVLSECDTCNVNEVNFPEQLVEFSGLGSDALIAKLAKQCKYLKALNVYGSNSVTDKSIESILQLKHLEKLNIFQTYISSKGITLLLTEYIKTFGEACKLKYLMMSVFSQEHLNIIAKKLPNLKVIVRVQHLNELASASFENVIGLHIKTFPYLNELLEKIGKQLIYLSIEVVEEFYLNEDLEISEMIPVGHNCTCLKSLRVYWFVFNYPSLIDTTQNPLPGFETISNLQFNINKAWGTDEIDVYEGFISIIEFLLFNCANIQKLALSIKNDCIYSCNKYNLVRSAVEKGFFKKVKEIHFSLHSLRNRDNEIVQLLIDNCPNLRYIAGVPGLDKNHTYNTQRLKFSSEYYLKHGI